MKENIIAAIAVVALLVSAVVFWHQPSLKTGPSSFGATAAGGMLAENYIPYVLYNGGYNSAKDLNITGGITFGSSGTTFTRANPGQCFLAPTGTTIAASTTVAIDCQATAAVGASGESALTGVTLGDNVIVELSTTTAQVNSNLQGLVVIGASASTTSGFITLRLQNNMGATFTWPTSGTASGTASYWVTK